MNCRQFYSYILLLALSIPFINTAAQTQSIPISFGTTIFGNYSYTIDGIEGKDANKFDLERVYFTLKAQPSDDVKVQVTTDIYRNAGSGSYYNGMSVRLKFGFIDYSPISALSVKFGMIPGPWNGSVEQQWKYRGVAATASDKYGYFATADLGASVTYTLPEKFGEVAAYILNGEGFTNPESNRFKDYVVRATLTPFPANDLLKSFTVGGYSYIGTTGSKRALKKHRFGGLIGYSYSIASVGAEYNIRKDAPTNPDTVFSGNVFSVFGEVKAPFEPVKNKLSLIWRYDVSEPNESKGRDMLRFYVLGLAYKVSDKLTVVFDRQDLIAEGKTIRQTAGTFTDKDKRWFLHTILNL